MDILIGYLVAVVIGTSVGTVLVCAINHYKKRASK